MKQTIASILAIFIFTTFSCKKNDESPINIENLPLLEAIDYLKSPLSISPLEWTNQELSFLDDLKNKPVIGLGEATHGTKEFFEAKHRIFQYLVENHGFKTFAMEADLGESIFINQAIQEGRTADIRSIMEEKMLFSWVWLTEEVLILLEWMSEYNKGKADSDKIQYVGIDCQMNEYYSDFLLSYLKQNDLDLYESSKVVLMEAKRMTKRQSGEFSSAELLNLKSTIEDFQKIFNTKEEALIETSSVDAFNLNRQYLQLILQIIDVRKAEWNENPRDKYMTENALWNKQYHGNHKMVIWAHNTHVGNFSATNTQQWIGEYMGHFLKNKLKDDYQNIAFSFSGGSFNARKGGANNSVTAPQKSTWHLPIEDNTINSLFGEIDGSPFAIEVAKLNENIEWNNYSTPGKLNHISVGAVFYPESRHFSLLPFYSLHYDYLIHFDRTTPTDLFQ